MSRLELEAEELQDMLANGRRVRVFDIRDRDAYEEWRVPGSRHLEWDVGRGADGEGEVACGDLAAEEPVVVVCSSGNSSLEAAREMRERCGIEARSLRGGMAGWSFAWNVAELEDAGRDLSVVQFRRTGKGCLSYLLGSGGEALVIDPALDPSVFQREAERRGWKITGVVETHVHADHLSRGRALAEAAEADHYLPAGASTAFRHQTLEDGDRLPLGDAELEALNTPGHTAAGLSYRAGDVLFTGDTLFLESVGRPDLEARGDREQMRRHARELYRSVSRLLSLAPALTVLPAHTSEPVAFDGEPVAAELGEVRERIDVTDQDEDAFVRKLVAAVPSTPPNYERIVRLNERGEFPGAGVADLEAGANRCAAS